MQEYRRTIDGCEYDWTNRYIRRWYGHKAGGGRYIKAKMNRRFRRLSRLETERERQKDCGGFCGDF